MTAPARDRRDRLRAMLADLKMPGALEAVDGVLAKVDSGAVNAIAGAGRPDPLRNNRRLQAAMRSSRLPAVKTLAQFDFTFQPTSSASRSRACTSWDSSTAARTLSCSPAWGGQDASGDQPGDQAGRRFYYGTLAGLIDSLMDARAAGALSRRLRVLTLPRCSSSTRSATCRSARTAS